MPNSSSTDETDLLGLSGDEVKIICFNQTYFCFNLADICFNLSTVQMLISMTQVVVGNRVTDCALLTTKVLKTTREIPVGTKT